VFPFIFNGRAPVLFRRFGGSAVLVFGEPAMWRPLDDLLVHTKEGVETLARLGEPIANAN
jgi:phosphatidylserine decarboxylase